MCKEEEKVEDKTEEFTDFKVNYTMMYNPGFATNEQGLTEENADEFAKCITRACELAGWNMAHISVADDCDSGRGGDVLGFVIGPEGVIHGVLDGMPYCED